MNYFPLSNVFYRRYLVRDSGGLEGSTAITRARRILDTEILLMRETAAPKIVQLLEVSAGEVPNYNLKKWPCKIFVVQI